MDPETSPDLKFIKNYYLYYSKICYFYMGGIILVKEFIINSGIRFKDDRGIVLTLYSMPFGRYLLKNNIEYTNLYYNKSLRSFIIKPGNNKKILIERKKENQPLPTFYITKLIPKDFYDELKRTRKQKRINTIIQDFISKEELLNYNNQIAYTKPLKLIKYSTKYLIKVGCFISAFKHKSGFNYRLTLRHKMLEEIVNKGYKIKHTTK